jgi:hypothetical protein
MILSKLLLLSAAASDSSAGIIVILPPTVALDHCRNSGLLHKISLSLS